MAGKRIVIPNYMPALDIDGNPVAGAKLYFYENGTTTLASVYTSAALNVAHPNPVVANAAGVFPSIFADEDEEFSVALTDADGLPISGLRNRDNIQPSLAFLDGVDLAVSAAVASVLEEDTLAAFRTAVGASTSAEVIAALEAGGADIDGDLALSATFATSPDNMRFYGDSITFGYVGASVDNTNCWRAVAAARRGKASLNYGIPGGSIMDITHLMTGTSATARHPVLSGDETCALFGYNDQRFNGDDPGLVRSFGRAVLAAAVWQSIPDDKKTFATDSAITYSGTWASSPAKNGDWKFTSQDGDYAEVTREGSVIYILVLRQTTEGATVEVTVDGELKATEDLSTSIGNGGAIRWTAGAIDNDTGTPLSFQVDCIRIEGLSRGRHTVRITKTGGSFLHLGCFASNGGVATASARLYLGNPLQISPTGAALDAPYDNYTDAGNRMHTEAVEGVVRMLRSDGLDVRLIDANSSWDPVAVPAADHIHPPITGHASIAAAFLRGMDISLPIQPATSPAPNVAPLEYDPVLAGSSTAGAHTYTTQEGSYVLMSGLCYARGVLVLSAFDTDHAGYTYLSLPVEAAALTAGVLGRMGNVTLDTGYSGFYIETVPGTARAIIRQNKSADVYGEVTSSNFADDSEISFSVVYPYAA